MGVLARVGQTRYRAVARLIPMLFLAWFCCPAGASATTTLNPPTDLQPTGGTETSASVSWAPSDSPGVTG